LIYNYVTLIVYT